MKPYPKATEKATHPPMRTICSWCGRMIHDIPEDSRGTSHGMCGLCFTASLAKMDERQRGATPMPRRPRRTFSEWIRSAPPADAFVLGMLVSFLLTASALTLVNHEQRADLIEMYETEITEWEGVAGRAYDTGFDAATRLYNERREVDQ
jgi:hypothetical protein